MIGGNSAWTASARRFLKIDYSFTRVSSTNFLRIIIVIKMLIPKKKIFKNRTSNNNNIIIIVIESRIRTKDSRVTLGSDERTIDAASRRRRRRRTCSQEERAHDYNSCGSLQSRRRSNGAAAYRSVSDLPVSTITSIRSMLLAKASRRLT